MLKLLNKVSVKLGIIFVLGIIGGYILYYNVALPLSERGVFAIPVILFPCYLVYMAMKIIWELFE